MKKLTRIVSAVLTAAMLSSVALCAPFTVSAAETDGNSTSVLNNVEVDSETQEATEQSSAESTEAVESEKEETVYRGLISDKSKLKQSAEADGDATESGEYVTRLQWLSDLTETFNMTVEEDNYPDNYFSDISSSDSCYHAVMLATEFGVINVEAGGEVRPNDYATRDFCASTLNYCLGFKLDEGTTYTYDDYAVTTHPEDAQIAINRGWFNPSDNKFEQDSYVTPEESKAMLADAAGVLDKTKVDLNYNNKFEFNENVIVVPKGTVASKSDDTVTIYNSSVAINNGDTFAVYFGEVPDIFIASKVEKSGTKTVISVTEADFDESVKTADAEGTEECSVSDIEPAEGVELSFEEEEDTPAVVSGSPLLKSSGSKNLKSVNAKKTLKLGDVSLTIKCKLYNLSADYIVKSGANRHYMVRINGEAEVTTTASVKDIISALGGESSIDIMSYSVPGIGKVGISLYVSISGEITLIYDTYFSVGAEYTSGSGFRTINNFYKKSFSVTADINADIGVKASAEVNIMNVISGGLWARMGLKANLNIKSYTDGKSPKTCTTFRSWLYADMGCYIGISAFGFSKSYSDTITFFDQSNSPVRLYFHNEDGKQVSHCSRGDCSYITSGYSRYGYSGYGSGSGYNAAGEPITIFKYSLDSDNNATITGYYGNVSALAIPKTIDGYTVVGIGNKAFEGNTLLKVVTIPDSVTSIGNYAFRNCTSLKNVILSKSLQSMGYLAFAYTPIESIEIPKSLDSCWRDTGYYYTFNGKSYSSIYAGPFYSCEELKTVTFEKGVTEISQLLFSGCVGLETVTIPDTVTTIEDSAFRDCFRLNSVKIPDSVTNIDSSAFYRCVSLTECVVPDSVTSMGESIFANCLSLETVTLPSKRQNITASTFQNCSSLKTVNFTDSVTNIQEYAFSGCTALESIKLSGNLTDIAQYAFNGCTSLKEISIPDKVKNIGYAAFQNCSSLVTVNIPSRVKSIGSYAFQNCELLENVNIADYSIKTINEATFKDCPALKKITLPKGLTTISKLAFANDTALAEVTIPESVTSITTDAFSYPAKMTAYGYEKSYAKTYCDEKGIKFVDNHILSQGICIDPSVCDSEDYIIMDVGETKEMKFEVYPLDSNDVITLTSDNTRVSIDGMHITSKSAGDSVITATATSGVTYSFTIHTRSVKNVTLNSLPVKTKYNQGENFDSKGMELQVNYGDKSTKITEDYTISGYDPDTIGIQTITVSYVGLNGSTYKTTFEIEVVDPRGKLTGISIAKLPNKLNYKKYESLDTTGLVVVENYDSGVSVEISDYSVSGYNALKLGKQTITVTKGEFSTSFEVTVSDKSSAVIGDVNGDGSVTVLDATMLQKYLAGLVSFSDEQLAVADTNGDGQVTVLDATAIQKYLANLITSLG